MFKAVIANTEAKVIAYHWCSSWTECSEWISSYLTFHGISRLSVFKEHGQMTAWVQA